jgi:hypothetical protein
LDQPLFVPGLVTDGCDQHDSLFVHTLCGSYVNN